jgi:hypothetical protein
VSKREQGQDRGPKIAVIEENKKEKLEKAKSLLWEIRVELARALEKIREFKYRPEKLHCKKGYHFSRSQPGCH